MRRAPAVAILAAAVFAAFAPCLANGFTNWDDDLYLTKNPLVFLPASEVHRIFLTPVEGQYTPLVTLVFWVEQALFGAVPAVVHAGSVALHAANAILVFLLFAALSKRPWAAFFAALFFALHPMRVEAVAWASATKDVLYALFYLSGLLAWTKYRQTGSRHAYAATMGLFVLSLLSKPMAMTFPLALVAIERFFPFEKKRNESLIPFFAVAVGAAVLALKAHPAAHQGAFPSSLPNPILALCYAPLFYISKTLVPLGISSLYPRPETHGTIPLLYKFGPAILALLCYGTYRARRVWPGLAFAAVWFAVTIWPILPVFRFSLAIVADRYTYLPALGIFWALAEGGERLLRKRGKAALPWGAGLAAAAALILGFMTAARCPVWRNDLVLWTDVISKHPQPAFAHLSRAAYFREKGRLVESLADYTRTVEIRPDQPEGWNGRGAVRFSMGDKEGALADFTRAIELRPGYARGYANRGVVLRALGREAESDADWKKASELDPSGKILAQHR